MTSKIYQGDDLRAFGGIPIEVTITNETGIPIKKLVFTCGNVIRKFEDLPEFSEAIFTILIYLTDDETRILQKKNKGYIACWDEEGHKMTTDGSFELEANEEVVHDKIRS